MCVHIVLRLNWNEQPLTPRDMHASDNDDYAYMRPRNQDLIWVIPASPRKRHCSGYFNRSTAMDKTAPGKLLFYLFVLLYKMAITIFAHAIVYFN